METQDFACIMDYPTSLDTAPATSHDDPQCQSEHTPMKQPLPDPMVTTSGSQAPPTGVLRRTEGYRRRLRQSINYSRYNKPPYTYIGMIAMAIELSDKKMLSLGEILKSLTEMFDFFRESDYKGWRDSVRHNLSHKDCFYKKTCCLNLRKNKWCVDYTKLPENAFALQTTGGKRPGNWAPTLHEQLSVAPVTWQKYAPCTCGKAHVESAESLAALSNPLDPNITPLSCALKTTGRGRELDDVSETPRRSSSTKRRPFHISMTTEQDQKRQRNDTGTFSSRNYNQLKMLISDTSLPFGVEMSVAMSNLSNLCVVTSEAPPTPNSAPGTGEESIMSSAESMEMFDSTFATGEDSIFTGNPSDVSKATRIFPPIETKFSPIGPICATSTGNFYDVTSALTPEIKNHPQDLYYGEDESGNTREFPKINAPCDVLRPLFVNCDPMQATPTHTTSLPEVKSDVDDFWADILQ